MSEQESEHEVDKIGKGKSDREEISTVRRANMELRDRKALFVHRRRDN